MFRKLMFAFAVSTFAVASASALPVDRQTARAATESAGGASLEQQMLGNGPCRQCRCTGFQPMGNGAFCYCSHHYQAHWNIHIPN